MGGCNQGRCGLAKYGQEGLLSENSGHGYEKSGRSDGIRLESKSDAEICGFPIYRQANLGFEKIYLGLDRKCTVCVHHHSFYSYIFGAERPVNGPKDTIII